MLRALVQNALWGHDRNLLRSTGRTGEQKHTNKSRSNVDGDAAACREVVAAATMAEVCGGDDNGDDGRRGKDKKSSFELFSWLRNQRATSVSPRRPSSGPPPGPYFTRETPARESE